MSNVDVWKLLRLPTRQLIILRHIKHARYAVPRLIKGKRVKASPFNNNFTSEEDCFLKKDIEKYGKGAWSRILRDPQVHSNANRSRERFFKNERCQLRPPHFNEM